MVRSIARADDLGQQIGPIHSGANNNNSRNQMELKMGAIFAVRYTMNANWKVGRPE